MDIHEEVPSDWLLPADGGIRPAMLTSYSVRAALIGDTYVPARAPKELHLGGEEPPCLLTYGLRARCPIIRNVGTFLSRF